MMRIVLSLLLLGVVANATEPSATLTTESAAQKQNKKKPVKLGRTARSTKDTDGSEAPNRFEAETVIKSQYTLDGKSLEVDTD